MLGNVSKRPAPERRRIELDAKKCRFRVLIGRESRRESWAGGSDEGPRRRATFSFNEGSLDQERDRCEALRPEPRGTSALGRQIQTRDRRLRVETCLDKRLLSLIADVCDATGNESLRLRGLLSDQKRAGERGRQDRHAHGLLAEHETE